MLTFEDRSRRLFPKGRKPLGIVDSVNTRIENAVAAAATDGQRENEMLHRLMCRETKARNKRDKYFTLSLQRDSGVAQYALGSENRIIV